MPLTIKKWITTKLFGTVANDYNDNLDAIKAFVDGLETNASLLPILATITGSILEHATSLGAGLYVISTGANTTDLPDASFKFMPAIICKQSQTNGVILAFSYAQPSKFAIRIRTSSGWGDWKVFS
jgi:hypothetical protein